jgi:hypothetical protein
MAPNGVTVTEEMLEGARLLSTNIVEACGGEIYRVKVEQYLAADSIHPDNGGTPDAWAYIPQTKTLYVWDYKYGHGFVDVVGNEQLINYVALIDLSTSDDVNVVMRIVQPRCYSGGGAIREWRVMLSDLRPYFDRLHDSAREAVGPNPRTISGNWCQYCAGRHVCKALKRSAMAAIDYVDDATPEPLDNANIALEWRMLKLASQRINSRLTAIEADITARIAAKQDVMGAAIERTQGPKKWAVDAEEVAILGDLFGVDLRMPLAVITPTQALAKKGIDGGVISAYYETPYTGFKLVEQNELQISSIFK